MRRGDRGRGEGRRDVQVVTQYPGTENAHGEEITAQAGVAAENASDGFVAIFFVHESVGRSVGEALLAYHSERRCSMRSD